MYNDPLGGHASRTNSMPYRPSRRGGWARPLPHVSDQRKRIVREARDRRSLPASFGDVGRVEPQERKRDTRCSHLVPDLRLQGADREDIGLAVPAPPPLVRVGADEQVITLRACGLQPEGVSGHRPQAEEGLEDRRRSAALVEDPVVAGRVPQRDPNHGSGGSLASIPPEESADVSSLLILRHLLTIGWVDEHAAVPLIQLPAEETRGAILKLVRATVFGHVLLERVEGSPEESASAWRLGTAALGELLDRDRATGRVRTLPTRSQIAISYARARGRILNYGFSPAGRGCLNFPAAPSPDRRRMS